MAKGWGRLWINKFQFPGHARSVDLEELLNTYSDSSPYNISSETACEWGSCDMRRYKVIKELGDGTYGSVSLARAVDSGDLVAVKK